MGLRIKSFSILGFIEKCDFFKGGRVHEKPVYRETVWKGGRAWKVCRSIGGEGLRKKGIDVSEGRVDTPMHTMKTPPSSIMHLILGFTYVLGIISWWQRIYKSAENSMTWSQLNHELFWLVRMRFPLAYHTILYHSI